MLKKALFGFMVFASGVVVSSEYPDPNQLQAVGSTIPASSGVHDKMIQLARAAQAKRAAQRNRFGRGKKRFGKQPVNTGFVRQFAGQSNRRLRFGTGRKRSGKGGGILGSRGRR